MIELIGELTSLRRDVAWLKRAVQALLDQQGITPIPKGMFDSDEQLDEFPADLPAERREATGHA